MEFEEDVEAKEEGFIAIKELDLGIEEEEIPEAITFPKIKSEPDEGCRYSATDRLKITANWRNV
jgi:hypothetical protein